jgi:hypothetical protein
MAIQGYLLHDPVSPDPALAVRVRPPLSDARSATWLNRGQICSPLLGTADCARSTAILLDRSMTWHATGAVISAAWCLVPVCTTESRRLLGLWAIYSMFPTFFARCSISSVQTRPELHLEPSSGSSLEAAERAARVQTIGISSALGFGSTLPICGHNHSISNRTLSARIVQNKNRTQPHIMQVKAVHHLRFLLCSCLVQRPEKAILARALSRQCILARLFMFSAFPAPSAHFLFSPQL